MERKEHKKERSRGDVKIGISIGDVNGIGVEVTMRALEDSRILQDCTPIIYGSQKLFTQGKKQFRMNNFNFNGMFVPYKISENALHCSGVLVLKY